MARTSGGAGGGGAGNVIVRHFPFAWDSPGILTGYAVYTPTVGDILLDAWVEIDTGWDGVTPLGDAGPFEPTNPQGWFAFNGLGPIDMTQADDPRLDLSTTVSQPGGMGPNSSDLMWSATTHLIIWSAPHLTDVFRSLPAKFVAANPIKVCVSRDGTNVTTPAFVVADAPATVPLVVVTGVNDTFVYTPVSTGTPEIFTVAAGVYNTIAAVKAAMGNAIGAAHGELFGTLIAVDGSGASITLTASLDNTGIAHNGDTISFGATDVAASLGFTGNPDTFAGGTGGSPGSSVGNGVLYLVTATPA